MTYVLRPWRRVSVPRGVPVWRVPWKQEGQDILGMGRGGRKVERDGRWIMWSMDAGLTGRDGNRGGGFVHLSSLVKQSRQSRFLWGLLPLATGNNYPRDRSCIISTIELSESVESFIHRAVFYSLAFYSDNAIFLERKVLQDSSSQSHVVRCLPVREPGRRNPAPARYLPFPFPRASWLHRIGGIRWRG